MTAQGARADLLHLINGFQASQAIHVAATLGLADLLRAGPKSTADLAASTGTHPVALYRLMRALASIGVLREAKGRRFALTPIGEFLRSDVVGTHAPMAELIGRPTFWQAWDNLLHAVRTGGIAFDDLHGRSVWAYRAEHPEEERIFDRAMAAGTEGFAEAVLVHLADAQRPQDPHHARGDWTALQGPPGQYPHERIGKSIRDRPRNVS